jgi:DNA-binding SARP family transcriptional activator
VNASPPPLQIRVLGELEVVRSGVQIALPPSKKVRALLAYLALTGRGHRRERLCALLWDVVDDPRGALRWTLSKVRGVVDDEHRRRLLTERETVALDLGDVEIDLVQARRVASDIGAQSPEALEASLGAFRGELLEGLELADFDEYQAWSFAEREAARRLRVQIVRAALEQRRDEPERAIPHARALVRVDPLDQGARAGLIELLLAVDRRQEAEQQLASARRMLAEVGATPDHTLRNLERSLRRKPAPAQPDPTTPRPVSSPIMKTTIHGLPMVGRTSELERVIGVFEAAVAKGRGAVIVLDGEPGIGKSRLLVELMFEARRRRGTVLEGCAYESERARPYGPWIDALRRLPSHEIGAARRQQLEPLMSSSTIESQGDWTREVLFETVADLVSSRAEASPLVLVALDDVQWFDPASADLLHYLVRTHRSRPVLVVLALRGGELPDNPAVLEVLRSLRRQRLVEEVPVGPLDRPEVERLIRTVAPGADVEQIFADSGGHPLFALELARAAPSRTNRIAPSLSQVVRDRIAPLAPHAADALRWASVLGTTFRFDLLAEVCGLGADELVDALETLERHALIGGVVDVQEPGNTFAFAHDVVRRVVHGELSLPRKRLMHRRVVDAMQRRPEGQLDSTALAHHALMTGDPALAVEACVAAARRCLDLFAYREAEAMVRRGLRHAGELEDAEGRIRELEALGTRAAEALAGG